MDFDAAQRAEELYDLYAELSRRAAEAVVVTDDRRAVRALAEGIYERLLYRQP